MSDKKPVKLELWAVPRRYGKGYVGVFAPEGTEPENLDTYLGIVHRVGQYEGDQAFDTPQDLADCVQLLLRNLREGKVGR